MNKCETCKHWFREFINSAGFAECNRISHPISPRQQQENYLAAREGKPKVHPDPNFFLENGYHAEDSAAFFTKKDFGCTEHQTL